MMSREDLTKDELRSLRSFRAAALQVSRASIVTSGAGVGIQGSATPEGWRTQFTLLAEEPFRSLAVSLRLVYMEGEPANYYRVCNILHVRGDDEVKEGAAYCRMRYKGALEKPYVQFALHGPFEGQVAGPKEFFEAWLYGLVFHQNEKYEAMVAELSKYMGGFGFPFAVNLVSLELVDAVLGLDSLVAHFSR